jgi:hypothetical protein
MARPLKAMIAADEAAPTEAPQLVSFWPNINRDGMAPFSLQSPLAAALR